MVCLSVVNMIVVRSRDVFSVDISKVRDSCGTTYILLYGDTMFS